MNLSDIRIIFVVVGLLPLLFLTGETNPFNNNYNNSMNIANQFAYAQQEKYGYNEDEIKNSIINDQSSSSSSSSASNQPQQSQQQQITIIGTDDFTCQTPIKEVVKLDEITIEPKERLLIADFDPCQISALKVSIYSPINPISKLGITYTDYYDYSYYNLHPSVKVALITPTKIQSLDANRGIFAIGLHDGEKWRDRLTGESTVFTNIDKLYLYNSGDEPLEFKSGDNIIIRATLFK